MGQGWLSPLPLLLALNALLMSGAGAAILAPCSEASEQKLTAPYFRAHFCFRPLLQIFCYVKPKRGHLLSRAPFPIGHVKSSKVPGLSFDKELLSTAVWQALCWARWWERQR